MTRVERMEGLQKARQAAQAVRDEIDRLNAGDPVASRQQEREPDRRRAIAQIRLLERVIDNLEAAGVGGDLDLNQASLAELDNLAGELDDAIRTSALVNVGLDTLGAVLTKAVRVKDILS